ncbi:ATP adenylyltransferase family protein [Kamptonema formosum]|uniref:ATP adenylyltransferase family protein n=1 Tax=Kamptonema formosum TaxID=331992 RepID=UPI00034550F5
MLETGTFWAKVKDTTERALRCGALQPIATECEFAEESGIRFLVRVASNLVRKDSALKQQDKKKAASGKEFNPFLPYDRDLFVADISETHLCLLNKFNAVDYHLLIVTREFEEQETLLARQDFEALLAVMAEFDGLAFYNSGRAAGASQRHKHLQLVPLPLTPCGGKFPIEPALEAACFQDSVGSVPAFPFAHAFARLDLPVGGSPLSAAEAMLERYCTLLRSAGLLEGGVGSENKLAGAYNLLATAEWMLVVPRSQEHFESISVNSLGFAGTLFVRNEEQLKVLKDLGPLTVLSHVGKMKG